MTEALTAFQACLGEPVQHTTLRGRLERMKAQGWISDTGEKNYPKMGRPQNLLEHRPQEAEAFIFDRSLLSYGLLPFRARPRRSQFLRGARRETRSLVAQMSRRVTTYHAKTGQSLRVARQIAPCVVAGFGKGTTITCIPRLAWRNLAQQRGSRRNGNRP